MTDPTHTDFCPRCDHLVDVWHEPFPGSDTCDVVCAHCKLIIDVTRSIPDAIQTPG